MTRLLLIIILLVGMAFPSTAQENRKDHRKEMRAELREFKLKFLAQEIDLKADKQPRFFKLYTELEEERDNAFREAVKLRRQLKRNKAATEEDYQRASEAMRQAQEKATEIDARYDKAFGKFLTQKQIYDMKQAEAKFIQKMKEMKQRNKDKKRNH